MKTYPLATEPALQPIYTCNDYKAPEMMKCEIYFSLMDRKLLIKEELLRNTSNLSLSMHHL